MADKIHLQIVTAGGVVFDRMVHVVNLPLENGSIGVLANHAPLMGAVVDGVVTCASDEGEFAIAVGIHDLIRIGHGPYGGGLSIDGSFRHVNDEVAFFIHAFRGKRDFKIRQDATVRVRSQQRIPDYPTLSGGDAVAVAAQRGRGNIQRFAAGAKRNGHIPHFAVRLGKNVVDVDLCVPRPLLTNQNAFELDGLNRKRHDERRHCDSNQFMHMLPPLFDD